MILFTGDLFISTEFSFKISADLQNLLERCNDVVINLEAPITNHEVTSASIGPKLRHDTCILQILKKLKVTHVNLANNHIYDFGEVGVIDTIKSLENYNAFGIEGVQFFASECNFHTVLEQNNLKIAIVSVCESHNGYLNCNGKGGFLPLTSPYTRSYIRNLKDKYDYIVLYSHAGLEMVNIPLPELRVVYREFIDIGVDLIIGHHPHILQGKEKYKGSTIYYSLGNFFMTYHSSEAEFSNGAVVTLNFNNDEVEINEYCLRYEKNILQLEDLKKSKEEILYLSRDLEVERYNKRLKYLYYDAWQNIYQKYYIDALLAVSFDPTLKKVYWMLIRALRFLKNADHYRDESIQLLLHNIEIESHRWCVQGYLRSRRNEI